MNTSTNESCLICAMETTDSRSIIFRDELWAAEIVPGMDVPGWCVLRSRRHAELITGLDDAEVDALGRRQRALVAAVAEVTGAPATYQLTFGEDHRHFHTLITARGEHISADRRRGDILKLREEGHRDLAACQAMVPGIRAAYARFVDQDRMADTISQ